MLQLGITFKENCPDIRNSRAVDVVRGLQEFGCRVDILDPWADPEEVVKEYGVKSVSSFSNLASEPYDAIVLVVPHRQFGELDLDGLKNDTTVIYDVKGFLPREIVDGRL